MKIVINEKGQSTIEFIFSFSFAFFLIIYTLKVALNYTTGYVAHYATYMASRTFLTYEDNGTLAASNPGTVFSDITKPVFDDTKIELYNSQFVVDQANLNFKRDSAGAGILNGVTFDWETSFSTVGLFGGDQTIHFKSESFLGREPDRRECSEQTCLASRGGENGRCMMTFTLVDNGC